MGDIDGLPVNLSAIGREPVAIHNDGFRTHFQLVERTVHGQKRGIKDIDFVNLFRRDHPDGPCHGVTLNNLAQLVTPVVGELLGVVDGFVLIIRSENHGCRIDTTRQTTPAGFVASSLYLSFVKMVI